VLNKVLTAIGPWPARLALAALLIEVEDPYRAAACLAVLATQIPIQRAILAWDAAHRRPVAVRAA
jgi:hypothetical protein